MTKEGGSAQLLRRSDCMESIDWMNPIQYSVGTGIHKGQSLFWNLFSKYQRHDRYHLLPLGIRSHIYK